MSRTRGSSNLFKGTDLQRLVRSARAAGLTVARVEVDTRAGKMAVVAGEPEPPANGDADLDRELAEFEARHGQV